METSVRRARSTWKAVCSRYSGLRPCSSTFTNVGIAHPQQRLADRFAVLVAFAGRDRDHFALIEHRLFDAGELIARGFESFCPAVIERRR